MGGQVIQTPPLGIGQTWQDMTASRATATNYTNTTGRSLAIAVYNDANIAATEIVLTVGGVVVADGVFSVSGAIGRVTTFAIVPPGAVYSYSSAQTVKFMELR